MLWFGSHSDAWRKFTCVLFSRRCSKPERWTVAEKVWRPFGLCLVATIINSDPSADLELCFFYTFSKVYSNSVISRHSFIPSDSAMLLIWSHVNHPQTVADCISVMHNCWGVLLFVPMLFLLCGVWGGTKVSLLKNICRLVLTFALTQSSVGRDDRCRN